MSSFASSTLTSTLALGMMFGVGISAASAGENAAASDTIVVSATRLPDATGAQTFAVSTIDVAGLERRQTSFLTDAIGSMPGVTITQNGAFGGQASVRIRGAANEQTLVLVDGVAINDPSSPGNGVNVGTLDTATIANVEVLRGAHSSLWGSSAIGGVINITTKRPTTGVTGNVVAEVGSFETARIGGGLSLGTERFDARLDAVGIRSDGVSRADERDGNTETDGFTGGVLNGRAGYDLSDDLRVEVFGRYAKSSTDVDSYQAPFFFTFGDTQEIDRSTERQGGLHVRYTMMDGRLEHLLTVSRADIVRRNVDPDALLFRADTQVFRADATRDALRYQGTFKANDFATIVFGAEREENDIKVEGFSPFGDSLNEGSTSIDGLFLLAELKPTNSLTITGGVRRDDHSEFGDVTTSRIGASWQATDVLGVRATWGQGFKAPTIFQLTYFDSFSATAPNTNLKPEEAEGWDVALTANAFDGRFSGEIGYFEIDTKNLINYSVTGPFSGSYDNIGRAESKGVELSARLALTDALSVAANYTYTDVKNALSGAKLPRIPEHAAFVDVDWALSEKAGVTLTARYNGEEDDFDPNTFASVVNDEWTRVDLAARYQLTDVMELFGRVENLTDELYQDVAGYGTPGRAAYVGARLRFE